MSSQTKKDLTLTAMLFTLFIVFTALVITVDVKPIGPQASTVGLATINALFHGLTGENQIWYKATEILGYLGLLTVPCFGLLGLVQLIQRRSLRKVDPDLYVLAVFYVLVAATYVFFEFAIVNYRPVLIDGVLEASYPSSHTMMICCCMITAIMQFRTRIANKHLFGFLNGFCSVMIGVVVVGRLLSGVHWFTDIVGALLLSAALIQVYKTGIHLVTES